MRISDWSSDVCSSDLLAAAQAQKEVTHNEALTLLDALVQPVVEAGPQNSPPLAPAVGQCWLVGAAPTAEWSAAAGTVAPLISGGWGFAERSAERHGGTECVSTCRSRWAASPEKKKTQGT